MNRGLNRQESGKLQKAGRLASFIGPSGFANWCLLKLGSYPPPETGRQGDRDPVLPDDDI